MSKAATKAQENGQGTAKEAEAAVKPDEITYALTFYERLNIASLWSSDGKGLDQIGAWRVWQIGERVQILDSSDDWKAYQVRAVEVKGPDGEIIGKQHVPGEEKVTRPVVLSAGMVALIQDTLRQRAEQKDFPPYFVPLWEKFIGAIEG